MGIVHALHALDEARLAAAVAFVDAPERASGLDVAAIRGFLAPLNLDDPARLEVESWDELAELLEEPGPHERGRVALAAASLASWDLDKAFDRPAGGFHALLRKVPALAPVRAVFLGGDPVPPSLDAGGEGLSALLRGDALHRAHEAIAPWLLDRERIAALPQGLLARLFGQGDFARAWRDDDYLWDNWTRLGEALRTSVERGAALGVVVG